MRSNWVWVYGARGLGTCSPPSQEPSVTSLQMLHWTFPGSSAGKESTCSIGDQGLIPGSGRSPGKGVGYSLQYSWASLVAQMVKNLPAMWETWVQSLGWEDPLEEDMATHSSILAWRIPLDRGAWRATVHGVTKSQHHWGTKHSTTELNNCKRSHIAHKAKNICKL